MNRRGETDWSLIAFLTLGVLVVWAGIIFVPVWADNFDVKEGVAAAFNRAGRDSDEQMRATIRTYTEKVGTHKETDEFGYLVEKTGLGVTDEQITIERDTVRNRVLVQVNYVREVKLKPLKKVVKWAFEVKREGPVQQ